MRRSKDSDRSDMCPDLFRSCVEIYHTLAIESPDTLRVGDEVHRCDPNRLITALHIAIYSKFYCNLTDAAPLISHEQLIAELCDANTGGVPGMNAETDQQRTYVAVGARRQPGTRWLRLYWNVDHRGAIDLMARASAYLNRVKVPFRLKVLLDVTIRRRDAAVLYVPRERWDAAGDVIADAYDALSPSGVLQPETPLFTKAVRPGIGVAEDPDTGASFGTHRSGLVARAMGRSYLLGHREDTQQWGMLREEFLLEGLSLSAPYLNAGSTDRYAL
jgi:hypothetical protein